MAKRIPLTQQKIQTNMNEMQAGTLHSGSKTGPKVTNPKQALAISFSEARKKGAAIPPPKGPPRVPFGG